MGALMTKVFLHKWAFFPSSLLSNKIKVKGRSEVVPLKFCRSKYQRVSDLQQHLLEELEGHYRTAKADMMLAAKSKPLHGEKWLNDCLVSSYRVSDFAISNVECLTGVLIALQRCLLEAPRSVCDILDRSMTIKLLKILEDISLLLLAMLSGDPDARVSDMGNTSRIFDIEPICCVKELLKIPILPIHLDNTAVWSHFLSYYRCIYFSVFGMTWCLTSLRADTLTLGSTAVSSYPNKILLRFRASGLSSSQACTGEGGRATVKEAVIWYTW